MPEAAGTTDTSATGSAAAAGVEAWESGELGETLDNAKVVSKERTAEIQEAAGMQSISIWLPQSVIEDFKALAQIEGIGYQTLMRTVLARFAERECKRIVREYAAQVRNEKVLLKVGQEMAGARKSDAGRVNMYQERRKSNA